jgi:hypothetical protein
MSSPAFEIFLTKVYVDAEFRARFLSDPRGTAEEAGLSADECEALACIDRTGLEMAAKSFASKREKKNARRKKQAWSFTGRAAI